MPQYIDIDENGDYVDEPPPRRTRYESLLIGRAGTATATSQRNQERVAALPPLERYREMGGNIDELRGSVKLANVLDKKRPLSQSILDQFDDQEREQIFTAAGRSPEDARSLSSYFREARRQPSMPGNSFLATIGGLSDINTRLAEGLTGTDIAKEKIAESDWNIWAKRFASGGLDLANPVYLAEGGVNPAKAYVSTLRIGGKATAGIYKAGAQGLNALAPGEAGFVRPDIFTRPFRDALESTAQGIEDARQTLNLGKAEVEHLQVARQALNEVIQSHGIASPQANMVREAIQAASLYTDEAKALAKEIIAIPKVEAVRSLGPSLAKEKVLEKLDESLVQLGGPTDFTGNYKGAMDDFFTNSINFSAKSEAATRSLRDSITGARNALRQLQQEGASGAIQDAVRADLVRLQGYADDALTFAPTPPDVPRRFFQEGAREAAGEGAKIQPIPPRTIREGVFAGITENEGIALQEAIQNFGENSGQVSKVWAGIRAAREAQKFSPAVESVIEQYSKIGGGEGLVRSAMADAMEPAIRTGRLRQTWNYIYQVASPAVRRNPDVQTSYVAANNLAQTQRLNIRIVSEGVKSMMEQAFGKPAVIGDTAAMKPYYVGHALEAGSVKQQLIGTLRHVFEFPDEYQLNLMQKRAVDTWNNIHKADLELTKALGVDIGEIQGAYVHHAYRDTKAYRALAKGLPKLGTRGKGAFAKERELGTLEAQLEYAVGKGLEIETDMVALLQKRFGEAARLRSGRVFLDSLEAKVSSWAGKGEAGLAEFPKFGKVYKLPSDAAGEVEALFANPQLEGITQGTLSAANLFKGVLLGVDVFAGRQGLLAFVGNPLGALKAPVAAYQMAMAPEGYLTWLTRNAPGLQYAERAGLRLSVTPLDTAGFKLAGENGFLADKIPIIKQLNKAQFERIQPRLKYDNFTMNLSMLKNVRDGKGLFNKLVKETPVFNKVFDEIGGGISKMTDDELAKKAAEMTNNWLGGIDWALVGRGNLDPLRQLLFLTEGWTRAQIGTVLNAPRLSPQGILARRLLAQEVAIGLGVTTAVATIMGWRPPSMNPNSQDFGILVTPFGKLNIFPQAALFRTTAQVLAGKPEEFGGESGAFGGRADAIRNYAEGRGGQFPRYLWDVSSGKDIYGRDVGTPWQHALRAFAPIIGGTLYDSFEEERGPGETAFVAAGQVTGFNTRPLSEQDRLNAWLKQNPVDARGQRVDPNSPDRVRQWYGEDGIEPGTRGDLKQQVGVKQITEPNGRPTTSEKIEVKDRAAQEEQAKRDRLLETGGVPSDEWRDYIRTESIKSATRRETLEILERVKYGKAKSEDERALAGYYAISDEFAAGQAKTGIFDKVGYNDAVDYYLANLDKTTADYVLRNLHPNATPAVKEYYQLRRTLAVANYWDSSEFAKRLDWYSRLPQEAQSVYADFVQYRKENGNTRGFEDKYILDNPKTGVASLEKIKDADRRIETARTDWLKVNPDIDAQLVRFYGNNPVTPLGQAAKVRTLPPERQLEVLVDTNGNILKPEVRAQIIRVAKARQQQGQSLLEALASDTTTNTTGKFLADQARLILAARR